MKKAFYGNTFMQDYIRSGADWAFLSRNWVHGHDAGISRSLPNGWYLDAVFDGVTYSRGGIASRLAAELFFEAEVEDKTAITHLLEDIDKELRSKYGDDPARTTATIALSHDGRLYVVNSGNSPAFLIKDGKAENLATMYNDSEEPSDLTTCLGHENGMRYSINEIEIPNGVKLLLCTDGFSDNIHADTITDIMSGNNSPRDSVIELDCLATSMKRRNEGFAYGEFQTDDRTAFARFYK